MENNSNFDLSNGRAIVNTAAFRLIMEVVRQAVFGDKSLSRDSQVIKDLYDFMESDKCRIIDSHFDL